MVEERKIEEKLLPCSSRCSWFWEQNSMQHKKLLPFRCSSWCSWISEQNINLTQKYNNTKVNLRAKYQYDKEKELNMVKEW